MRFLGAARRLTVLVAVAAVAAAGANGAVARSAAAAVVKPHDMALLASAKPHRPAPKAAAGGYSAPPARRRPPKVVSEIVADRTATSSTWRDADGSITVRSYATPQFYQPSRSSGWVPIVTRLSAVAGKPGWWRSGADSWQASFGPAGAAGGAEQVSVGGAHLGFAPEGVTSQGLVPSVSGSTATYAGLWPHVNMTEQVTSAGVTEGLMLTGPGAAASYTFALSGATAVPGRSGGLTLVAGGKTVGVIPASAVVTAGGSGTAAAGRHARPAALRAGPRQTVTAASGAKLTAAGGQVTLSVSAKWLASLPKSAYPLLIDPSFSPSGPDITATQAESFSSGGSANTSEAQVGVNSAGTWAAAAFVPFPAPPTVAAGQQPWEPAEAVFDAECPSACGLNEDVDYLESAKPASYNAILGGHLLYENTLGQLAGVFQAYFTQEMSAHESGAWFGFTAVEVLNAQHDSELLSIPDSDIFVAFTYYQEPPPPQVTSPGAGSVLATITPTLTASVADTSICKTESQTSTTGPNGGSISCDNPGNVSYDFQVSTSPVWGSGQVVTDSGWIPQPYTTVTGNGTNGCASGQTCYNTTPPTWRVPPGALDDGMTYYITVQDADTIQNPEWGGYDPNPLENGNSDEALVPAAVPLLATEFTVKLRLGAGGPSPTDNVGAPPGQTSVPSQGAPSPGLSPSSETVNMVTGDLALSVGTPSMTTLSGPAGVNLTYDSLQSSTQTGTDYGLSASFYPDSGSHAFPASTVSPAGQQVEPDIDVTTSSGQPVEPPVPGIAPQGAYLARWTGTITLPSGSSDSAWQLGGVSTGGMRIYLDGSTTPVFNDWSGTDSGMTFESATVTGTHQIEVDAWEPAGGDGTIQLWANNVTNSSSPVPEIVTSSWLTPAPTGLPPGWSIDSTAPQWTSATELSNQIVLHSPAGDTAAFTSNGNGTWTPQAGDTDSLAVVNGLVQVSSDGYLYQFNSAGQLASMTTIADDLHPAALQYTYGPDTSAPGTSPPIVLQSIKDPLSGRSITLSYGTACGTDPNSAGLLCGISYWDGTTASFVYNGNDQLAEVINPGTTTTSNTTLFGYDSTGRLDDIRDALASAVLAAAVPGEPACSSAADGTCVLDTWITYNSSGQVATVTQPQPQPGAARPERSYAYFPSAATAGAGSTTVTIAGFSPAGTGCTQPAPGCSPPGVANSVTYNAQSQITSQTSSTGLTSYTVWDAEERPIISVDAAGEQTSTVYDISSDVTDTYGPAPAACFDPATIPSGVTVTGPVKGYLPLTGAANAAGCGVTVPHTQTSYDQNMTGLASTYFPNGQNADESGQLHGTGDGSESSSTPGAACSTWGGTSAADLCASWPQGTAPQLEGTTLGTDSAGEWSLQMTGTITTPNAGDQEFCVADTQNFNMSIDGNLVLTNEYYINNGVVNWDHQGTYSGTAPSNCGAATLTAGAHTIEIDVQGSPAQATSFDVGYVPPGGNGPPTGVPLSWLDPAYGLKTATTDPDGKTTSYGYTDSADHIGLEYGLVTSTTQDPGGLGLTTATSYEDPTQGGFLRKTATTLPAGNQTTYSYYTGTGGPVAAACGVSASTPQGGQVEQQTDPAPGGSGQARIQQFIYDVNGRQAGVHIGTASDIATAPWQCTSYDAMGRMTSQAYPAANGAPARTVTYSYSVGGNPLVSSVSDSTGMVSSTVDLLGRDVSYTDAWGQTTTATYNQAGQTTASSGPGGAYTYGFDPNSGQPITTTVKGTLLATASYDPATGRMTSVAYGNVTQAAIGYDAYGHQDSLTYTNTSSGNVLATDSATYSLAGRKATETTSQPGTSALLTISYGYDGAARLTSATGTAGGTAASTYSYAVNPASDNCPDPLAGENTNRTSVTTTTASAMATTDYCYNNADQLTSTVTGGTADTSYAYNEHGDQTTDNGTIYTWDASDRVATATTGSQTITSTYDAVDRLIQSSSSTGSTVRYSYAGYTDTPAAVLNTSNNVLQQLVALPGGVTATLQSSGNVWSYTNLQGDTIITASNTGTLTAGPVTYDPWGNLNPGQTAPANTTGPNTLGAYATNGKLTNTDTGTILLGARTFNPTEARFLSVDPVEGGCANPYTYAFGDPLNHPDLTGQNTCFTITADQAIAIGEIIQGGGEIADKIAETLGDSGLSDTNNIASIAQSLAQIAAVFGTVVGKGIEGVGRLANTFAARSGRPGATGVVVVVILQFLKVPYALIPVPAVDAIGSPGPNNGRAPGNVITKWCG